MNESETRAELIDPKLKACGWGVDNYLSTEKALFNHEETSNE